MIVNCYRKKNDERIKNYINFFKRFGEVRIISDENFKPDPDTKVYVISGFEKYISQNDFNPLLIEFLKNTELPVMGICHGHQLIAKAFDASIWMGENTIKKAFLKNPELIKILKYDEIFSGLPPIFPAEESHKDHVTETDKFKENFEIIASSDSCSVEAIKHRKKPIYGFQFHIERSGENGEIIARNFFRLTGEKNVKQKRFS